MNRVLRSIAARASTDNFQRRFSAGRTRSTLESKTRGNRAPLDNEREQESPSFNGGAGDYSSLRLYTACKKRARARVRRDLGERNHRGSVEPDSLDRLLTRAGFILRNARKRSRAKDPRRRRYGEVVRRRGNLSQQQSRT